MTSADSEQLLTLSTGTISINFFTQKHKEKINNYEITIND